MTAEAGHTQAADVTEPNAELQRAMCELTGVVTGVPAYDRLNLRTEPGAESPVMMTLDNDAVLRIRGERIVGGAAGVKWLLVSVGDRTGWVNARYVRL